MPAKAPGRKKAGKSSAKPSTVEELWQHTRREDLYNAEDGWYGKSRTYWADVPPTVNGVLNGKNPNNMAMWHEADIRESKAFIEAIPHMGRGKSLDCGAGMGRVTRDLLAPLYSRCDVLESQEHMLEQAQKELAGKTEGQFILNSMERVTLPSNTYDIIVIQLAAMYLIDSDLVDFFAQCKKALTKRGFIFLKENCAKDRFDLDPEDNGLMRTEAQFKELFAKASLEIIQEASQKHWPSDVANLRMFALR